MTAYTLSETGETLSHRQAQDTFGISFPRNKPPAGLTPYTLPAPSLDDLKARKSREINDARKEAEAQGVTVNGARYAGDSDSRRDMREALDYCKMTGTVAFSAWKDSDGHYHLNHPVSDVRSALMQIGIRRGQLIAREGEFMAQIDAAETEQDLDAITWQE